MRSVRNVSNTKSMVPPRSIPHRVCESGAPSSVTGLAGSGCRHDLGAISSAVELMARVRTEGLPWRESCLCSYWPIGASHKT